ncbi:unnamed protein product [Miscanthus lutarioriparius]|uniref:Uncharacterized protein n=1 Tax=Miscanthus lutarioriparius TaxID=422564 RepID=A0A811RTR6_9POAL|nr:unnamed protein product [Miscanthus lutarioriparius]
MGQVRLLAHDCNNCLDVYLSRGNPDIHLPKKGPLRYLLWGHWFLQKMIAQHQAAGQLKTLKERARDVGERRLRYSVKVPEKPASAAGDKEQDGGDDQLVVATATAVVDHSGDDGRAFFQPRTLDDYLEEKVVQWITTHILLHETSKRPKGSMIPSVSIVVAPEPDVDKDAGSIAHEALAIVRAENQFKSSVLVDIPSVHLDFMPLRPKEILYYILRELNKEPEHAKSPSQSQDEQEGEGTDEKQGDDEADKQYIERSRKWDIYFEKKELMKEVKRNIQAMQLKDKIEEIKKELEQGKSDKLLLWGPKKQMKKDDEKKKMKDKISEKNLGVLLLLLLKSATAAADGQDQERKNKDMPTLAPWYDDIVEEAAKKLQECIEKEEELEEEQQEEEEYEDYDEEYYVDEDDNSDGDEDEDEDDNEDDDDDKGPILLDSEQYANILREVFQKNSNSKPQQQGQQHDQDNTHTLGENQIKQIVEIEKAKLELLQQLLHARTSYNSKSPQAQEEDSLATAQATNSRTSKDPSTEKTDTAKTKSDGQDGNLQLLDPAAIAQGTIEKKEHAETSNTNKSLQAPEQGSLATGQATNFTMTVPEEGPSKKIIKKKGPAKLDGQDQNLEAIVQETKEKMEEVKWKINEQLKIRRIMDKIKKCLKDESAVIILKIHDRMIHDFPWDETRNALSFLDCIAGAVIVTNPSDSKQEYCYPQKQEPINYSLVGLYHDDILKRTSQKKHEKIIRDILDMCKLDEFCMKIFAHALYANPKRHIEDLNKLHSTLQKVSPNSPASIAKKVFKFSYNDLVKEYKSCLLYLAIFPLEYKIRRSTLIGRWVAEGLITTEDWLWSHSVCKAEKCFDNLIRRLLVHPVDFGATGEVKSCMVTKIIHGFITNIAEKQHIIVARLSHHLAQHFSIYNDLRPWLVALIQSLISSKSFPNHLPYSSLRGTNATQLPIEINNLQELEVLDIRQTKVPAKATRHIRLLKLKRLLAGDTDPSLSSTDIASVQVPEKVENMEHMEVLSNVKPLSSQDLKDIGTLYELRKLGLVIEDKDSHLRELFILISNLHKYLRSLSITLHSTTKREGTPYSRGYSYLLNATNRRLSSSNTEYHSLLKDPPKLLESLNISGTTQNVQLLQELLANGVKELVKVTLSNTSLKQDDLEVLGKLPKLRCFRLQDISCTNTKLTFNEVEFPRLKYFIFEGSSTTDISFQVEGTHGLEEIVLSLNIDGLPNMEHELEEHKSNNTATNTNTIAAATTGVSGLPTQEQNKSNTTTTTTTNATTTTTTEVNVLPKLEQESNKNDTTTVAATTTTTTTTDDATTTTDDATVTTDSTTTKVNVLPKLEQESNNNDTATVAATTTTVVDSLPKLEEQKSNNSTTTINTTTGVDSLPKQEEHDLHPITTTRNSVLLSLFDNNAKQIAKVTLRGTLLKEDALRKLAKKPKLRCLVLLEKSYDESNLTFNEDDFPKLNILIVNCSNINKINFTTRSAPKLEKIIWTFAKDRTDYSLSGINNLPKLKDFEFYGDAVPHQVREELNKHRNKPILKKNKPENQEQEIGNTPEEKGTTCFPFCWKNKV